MAGTYWYHGHHHDQFVEGLYGPLIILPPPREVPLANAIAYKDDVTFSIMDYYSVPAPTLVSGRAFTLFLRVRVYVCVCDAHVACMLLPFISGVLLSAI